MSQSNVAPESNPAWIYEQFVVPGLFVPSTQVLLEYADPQPGESVLDVACGTGIVTRNLAPRVGPHGRVVGLDISPAMLEVARSIPAPDGAAIEWKEGSALELPFPDDTFNLITCQHGVQFFRDRPLALSEMRRVLVPGGRVVLSVWESLDKHPVFKAMNDAMTRAIGVPTFVSPFSMGDPEELRRLLVDARFRQVDIQPLAITARFDDAERFVPLSVMGAAAAVPEVKQMDEAARANLIDRIKQEVDEELRNYRDGGAVSLPMRGFIGRGYA